MIRIAKLQFYARVALAVAGAICLSTAAMAQTPAPAPTEDQAAAQAVQLGRAGAFEIHVQGADLRGVLQLLSTQGRRNIVATKEVTGEVTADLYDVTFKEALDAIMRSTGYVYEEKANFVYIYTAKQLQDIKKSERVLEVKVFRLSYLTANDARALIAPALSEDGIVALTPEALTGIPTSSTEAGGNNYAAEDVLVVRDYEENVKHIADILERLDVKPDQVLIETTILRATLTENNDLGVDFNALSGIDFENLGATTTGMMDLKMATATNVNGSRDFGLDTDFASSVPDGGMTIGVITNNISMFIRALECITDVTGGANPKRLITNKQRGEILIGERAGYLTTTVTETVATQTVQFLETGTRLVVRPFIGRDDYIRMEIHPEDSSGEVTTVGTWALPSETTTEVTTNLIVRDGRTIVIGGLFRDKTTAGRSQVPVLGNIPYIGTMFRHTGDKINREEVIILVTPRIIRHPTDEGSSEQIKDDVERFRVGARKGLRWWGRDRLAQAHLRWAKRELAAGRRDKALWNVDMALSLSTRLEAAIRLKERLTEQAYWADESRISSIKYAIQKMVMQELGRPVERIILPGKPRNAEDVEEDVREALGITKRYEDPLPGPGTTARRARMTVERAVEPPEQSNGNGDNPEPAKKKDQAAEATEQGKESDAAAERGQKPESGSKPLSGSGSDSASADKEEATAAEAAGKDSSQVDSSETPAKTGNAAGSGAEDDGSDGDRQAEESSPEAAEPAQPEETSWDAQKVEEEECQTAD